MAHRTTWSEKGCIVDVTGEITGHELAVINNEISGSPLFDSISYFVVDFTGVQKQYIDLEALTIAAYINRAASIYKKKLRGAFIVGDAVTLKRVAHYLRESKNAGNPWEQKFFVERSSALTWAQGDT